MLFKGLVTKSKSEFFYVWSRSFGGEAILDKRLVPTNGWMPSVGDWIVFSIKDDSSFIDDFTDIPNLMPTKVNEHGSVMVSGDTFSFIFWFSKMNNESLQYAFSSVSLKLIISLL